MRVSNWADELEHVHLTLFNKYPDVITKLEEFDDEPYRSNYNEETDEYDDVYQWYVADIDWIQAESFDKRTKGEIKFYYSDALDLWILPVMHFGTPWNGVPVNVYEKGEQNAEATILRTEVGSF